MRARPAGVLGPTVEAGRTPRSPVLRHAFTVRVEVAAPLTVGRTAAGTRRVVPITGGAVTGPHGSGRVLPVGADYQVVGTEIPWLEAKYVLELAEGHPVYVDNRAMRVASAEDSRAIAQGIPVDPQRVYFRCAPCSPRTRTGRVRGSTTPCSWDRGSGTRTVSAWRSLRCSEVWRSAVRWADLTWGRRSLAGTSRTLQRWSRACAVRTWNEDQDPRPRPGNVCAAIKPCTGRYMCVVQHSGSRRPEGACPSGMGWGVPRCSRRDVEDLSRKPIIETER